MAAVLVIRTYYIDINLFVKPPVLRSKIIYVPVLYGLKQRDTAEGGCAALEPPDVQRGGSARFERQQPFANSDRCKCPSEVSAPLLEVRSPVAVQAEK
jgi:hypothetical protein